MIATQKQKDKVVTKNIQSIDKNVTLLQIQYIQKN